VRASQLRSRGEFDLRPTLALYSVLNKRRRREKVIPKRKKEEEEM
jgi:hypothetical protein